MALPYDRASSEVSSVHQYVRVVPSGKVLAFIIRQAPVGDALSNMVKPNEKVGVGLQSEDELIIHVHRAWVIYCVTRLYVHFFAVPGMGLFGVSSCRCDTESKALVCFLLL